MIVGDSKAPTGDSMRIVLTVIAGPHKGREFSFDRHDTFLVGRSKHTHFQLPAKDRYFSRIHFMMEVNPPACRLIDMGSHNGTYVNGVQVLTADLREGDQIRAGHTVLRVHVQRDALSAVPRVQAPTEAGADLPMVPGFILERELGRGALGVTYLGQRVGAKSSLAVKVVKPSFAGSATQVELFLRTARTLTQLEHPHIVRLREVGACADGFYFAAEFVPGWSAVEIVKRDGPLAIPRAVRWGCQMLDALQYAHARHFIHHDIKPTNVLVALVDGVEKALLADFGLARVYQAAPFSGLNLTAAMIERASFMPPELLFNYQNVKPLADQYSIAAVLYHLLTADQPLEMPHEPRRRFTSLLRRQCVPIGERRADVPPGLANVIHKALSRTPSQRFASSAEFRLALAAVH